MRNLRTGAKKWGRRSHDGEECVLLACVHNARAVAGRLPAGCRPATPSAHPDEIRSKLPPRAVHTLRDTATRLSTHNRHHSSPHKVCERRSLVGAATLPSSVHDVCFYRRLSETSIRHRRQRDDVQDAASMCVKRGCVERRSACDERSSSPSRAHLARTLRHTSNTNTTSSSSSSWGYQIKCVELI